MLMDTILYKLVQFWGDLYSYLKVDGPEILLQQSEGTCRSAFWVSYE